MATTASKLIEYTKLPPEIMDHYTRTVCEILAERIDKGFLDQEIQGGFRTFMVTVMELTVKQRNRYQLLPFDNASD